MRDPMTLPVVGVGMTIAMTSDDPGNAGRAYCHQRFNGVPLAIGR